MRRHGWVVAVGMLLVSCGGSATKVAAPEATTTEAPAPAATTTIFPAPRTKTSQCHFVGALPDPTCTPGALNPEVTQATIGATICAAGWTATVRPAATVTDRLKADVATAYGITDPLNMYQGDHLIPIELGGALADAANFWDQPNTLTLATATIVAAGQKDALETNLKVKVCADQLTLVDAQRQIAGDWLGAWGAAGRPGAAPEVATTVTTTTTTTSTSASVATTTRSATTAPPVVTTTAAPAVSYANCAAVKAAGKAPIRRGDPGYSTALDRDGDGIACET